MSFNAKVYETEEILSTSQECDIDLHVAVIPGWDAGALSYEERIVFESLSIFKPYGDQFRSIQCRTRSIRAVLSALDSLRPFTRLSSFNLDWKGISRTSRTSVVDLPDDPLFNPSFKFLDLSSATHCRDIIIEAYVPLEEIIFPHSVKSFTIMDTWSEVELLWKEFVRSLKAMSKIECLKLRRVTIMDSQSDGSQKERCALPLLRNMDVDMDISSLCAIISNLSLPVLRSLNAVLLPGPESMPMTVTGKQFIPSIHPFKPNSLTHLNIRIRKRAE